MEEIINLLCLISKTRRLQLLFAFLASPPRVLGLDWTFMSNVSGEVDGGGGGGMINRALLYTVGTDDPLLFGGLGDPHMHIEYVPPANTSFTSSASC